MGKELCADALRELSARKNAPFIRVNCVAITPSLLDAAFFGHEKGAFTGAGATHLGYFEQANGDTLFLDEVGELSANGQARAGRIFGIVSRCFPSLSPRCVNARKISPFWSTGFTPQESSNLTVLPCRS